MIQDINGQPLRGPVTETEFPIKLVAMLMALSDLLQQNGLGLFCMKCQRLGLPDGVKADNHPEAETYRLTCGCATRVFYKSSGHEKVLTH